MCALCVACLFSAAAGDPAATSASSSSDAQSVPSSSSESDGGGGGGGGAMSDSDNGHKKKKRKLVRSRGSASKKKTTTGAASAGASAGKSSGGGRGSSRRLPRPEGSTCDYPVQRPVHTEPRHSAQFAHPTFKHARWNFQVAAAVDAPPLLTRTNARQLLQLHLSACSGLSDEQDPSRLLSSLRVLSNGTQYELEPLQAVSTGTTPTKVQLDDGEGGARTWAAPKIGAVEPALGKIIGPNALVSLCASVSTMAWCPLGDASQSLHALTHTRAQHKSSATQRLTTCSSR